MSETEEQAHTRFKETAGCAGAARQLAPSLTLLRHCGLFRYQRYLGCDLLMRCSCGKESQHPTSAYFRGKLKPGQHVYAAGTSRVILVTVDDNYVQLVYNSKGCALAKTHGQRESTVWEKFKRTHKHCELLCSCRASHRFIRKYQPSQFNVFSRFNHGAWTTLVIALFLCAVVRSRSRVTVMRPAA